MSWKNIPGWSPDIEPFYAMMAERLPQGGVFVEIGVFLGRSLACMGTLRPDLELWAIDPWEDGTSRGYDGPGEYALLVEQRGGLWLAFLSLMKENAPEVLERTHIVRARTAQAFLPWPADLVFIDGAHDHGSVNLDIVKAEHAVRRPGGIVAGHDYGPNAVKVAVDAYYSGVQVNMGPDLPLDAKLPPGGKSTVWWVLR